LLICGAASTRGHQTGATMRSLLLVAILAVPALSLAEGGAIAEAAAITPGVDPGQVAKARKLFQDALRETGIEVLGAGGKGSRAAEFVASLSLAEVDREVVLTGQITRFRLDKWAVKAEVKVA